MADAQQSLYGYADDNVKVNPFKFGLNQEVFLTKFDWIPNGGSEGKEQEALDIKFSINGVEKSYRMFPVVKAFGRNGEEITDPDDPIFRDAAMDFNARMVHILHCYYEDRNIVKQALSRGFKDFKEYCKVAAALLPKNFNKIPLDIFLQYQWQIDDEQDKTYLDIPKKMKYGRWLCPAQEGTWKEQRVASPTEDMQKALWYIKIGENGEPLLDKEGHQIEHPFTKNGWFMSSNFAKQQRNKEKEKADGRPDLAAASNAMNTNATEAETTATNTPPPPVSTW